MRMKKIQENIFYFGVLRRKVKNVVHYYAEIKLVRAVYSNFGSLKRKIHKKSRIRKVTKVNNKNKSQPIK